VVEKAARGLMPAATAHLRIKRMDEHQND